MPSWRIHRKYAKLLGIPENVEITFEKWLDGFLGPPHDFWRLFVEDLSKSPYFSRIFLSPRIIYLRVNFGELRNLRVNKKSLLDIIEEEYGNNGIKALLLHVILDKIADTLRANWIHKGIFPEINAVRIEVMDHSEIYSKIMKNLYEEIFLEVENFVNTRLHEILYDIKKEIMEKIRPGPKNKRDYINFGTLSLLLLQRLFRNMFGTLRHFDGRLLSKPSFYSHVLSKLGPRSLLSYLKSNGDYEIFIKNLVDVLCEHWKAVEMLLRRKGLHITLSEHSVEEILSNEELLIKILEIFRRSPNTIE